MAIQLGSIDTQFVAMQILIARLYAVAAPATYLLLHIALKTGAF